jgi:hypothetical protein
MTIEDTTNSFGVIFFEFSIFDKSRQGKTIKLGWKKLHKIILKRYLQFGIVAIKISNFLPDLV